MAFTLRVLFIAIICSCILITVKASTWKHSSNEATLLGRKAHSDGLNTIFEKRVSVAETSGRSLVIKSLLLAPLGIALLVLAGLILLPIPVITTGRDFPNNRAIDLAKKVMTSEECVERMACELSNITKNYAVTSWIPRSIESYMKNSRWVGKLSKGFKADTCYEFNCNPAKSLSSLNKKH